MRMANFGVVVGAAVLLTLGLVGCGGGGSAVKLSEFVGRWECVIGEYKDFGDDNVTEMELFSDGTAAFKNFSTSVSGTWSVLDKRFVMSASVDGTNLRDASDYKLSGYELTFIDDRKDTTVFVKKEKVEEFKTKRAAAAAKGAEEARRSITTFTDSRDNKSYKKVKIGTQTWMAENLNYEASGSVCYENKTENCNKYGRLYNWAAAKGACPAGFHLPSKEEWTGLVNSIGGSDSTSHKLKSASGWKNNRNGTDDYGFSALPSGGGDDGDFEIIGEGVIWWSATEDEDDNDNAWAWGLGYDEDDVMSDGADKKLLTSVRCVQDLFSKATKVK